MRKLVALLLLFCSQLYAFTTDPVNFPPLTTTEVHWTADASVRDDVLSGLAKWNAATNNHFTFVEDADNPTIIVRAADPSILGTFLGYTSTTKTGQKISLIASPFPQIQTLVVLHELGHAFGMGHSNIGGSDAAVMFPTLWDGVLPELHADDIDGIRSLYGPNIPADRTLPFVQKGTGRKHRFLLTPSDSVGINQQFVYLDYGDGYGSIGCPAVYHFLARGTYTVTATYRGRIGTVSVKIRR